MRSGRGKRCGRFLDGQGVVSGAGRGLQVARLQRVERVVFYCTTVFYCNATI